jgi:hypothetical protein
MTYHVWTNQHCDTVVSESAPNAGYWSVFSGTSAECYTFLMLEGA